MIRGISLRPKYLFRIGLFRIQNLEVINEESYHVELLEITMTEHLCFKKHIGNLCRNANYLIKHLNVSKTFVVARSVMSL